MTQLLNFRKQRHYNFQFVLIKTSKIFQLSKKNGISIVIELK